MPRTWTTPELYLYGPDSKYGARPKRGLTSYRWYIRHEVDGRTIERGTGAKREDRADAEEALAAYLIELRRDQNSPDKDPLIAEVLQAWIDERCPLIASGASDEDSCHQMIEYFGERLVSELTPQACRQYDAWKAKQGQAPSTRRRALGVLRRALNHAKAEKRIAAVPETWLTPAGEARCEWIDRDEAARMLRHFRRLRAYAFHMLVYVMIALHHGQRREAILKLRWAPHKDGGWVDLENQRIDFRKNKQQTSKKRRAGSVVIPPKLMPVLRMARARSKSGWVVEFDGEPVYSVKTAWSKMRKHTGLTITPHDLSHTCISWMLQGGYTTFVVSKFVAKSVRVIDEVYGHIAEEVLEPNPKHRLRWINRPLPGSFQGSKAKIQRKQVMRKSTMY